MPSDVESQEAPGNPLRLLSAHLGLLLAGTVGASTGLLLMRVTRGNPETSLAILQAGGAGAALMGTALNLAPVIFAGVVGGSLSHVWRGFRSSTGWRRLAKRALVTVCVLIVAVAFTSALYLVASLVLAAFMKPKDTEPTPLSIGVALLALLGTMLLIARPWWPLEQIERPKAHGHDTVVGYVVASDGKDLTVLERDSLHVIRFAIKDASERQICSPEPGRVGRWFSSESVWSVLEDDSGYSRCR